MFDLKTLSKWTKSSYEAGSSWSREERKITAITYTERWLYNKLMRQRFLSWLKFGIVLNCSQLFPLAEKSYSFAFISTGRVKCYWYECIKEKCFICKGAWFIFAVPWIFSNWFSPYEEYVSVLATLSYDDVV